MRLSSLLLLLGAFPTALGQSVATVQAFDDDAGVVCHAVEKVARTKEHAWHRGQAVWHTTPWNVRAQATGEICSLPEDIADADANDFAPPSVSITCNGDPRNDVCDIFIYQFHSSDCPGGDGFRLLKDGLWCRRWQDAAPQIKWIDGTLYYMVAYRRQIDAGDTIKLSLKRKWTLVGSHRGTKDDPNSGSAFCNVPTGGTGGVTWPATGCMPTLAPTKAPTEAPTTPTSSPSSSPIICQPGRMSFKFLGDSKQFEVFQQCGFKSIAPSVDRDMTAAAFYDYQSASAHTGFEKAYRAQIFMYRNVREPDQLSLYWTNGVDDEPLGSGGQGVAAVWGSIAGIPDGTNITIADDNFREFGWDNNVAFDHDGVPKQWKADECKGSNPKTPGTNCPYVSGRWIFSRNTDGGALSSLPADKDWCLELKVDFDNPLMGTAWLPKWVSSPSALRGQFNDWRYYFADGTDQPLDTSKTLFICNDGSGCTTCPRNSNSTFCAMAPDDDNPSLNISYTFEWGDGTPNTVISNKAPSELACATHYFGQTGCPGNVIVIATNDQCGNQISKTLANATCAREINHPYCPGGPQ